MSVPKGRCEAEIRAAAVERARALWPGARIIHELNVNHGTNRADVAVVTADRLVLIELKSAADTLDRLDQQLSAFETVAHQVIVAADAKWFIEPPPEIKGSATYFKPSPIDFATKHRRPIWKFVEGLIEPQPHYSTLRTWPWPQRMLFLLWRQELERACHNLRISVAKRPRRGDMIDEILSVCRQPEVEALVLDALRTREFAAADEVAA